MWFISSIIFVARTREKSYGNNNNSGLKIRYFQMVCNTVQANSGTHSRGNKHSQTLSFHKTSRFQKENQHIVHSHSIDYIKDLKVQSHKDLPKSSFFIPAISSEQKLVEQQIFYNKLTFLLPFSGKRSLVMVRYQTGI